VPASTRRISVVFTNTSNVAPYRGAGQPEAIYLIERLIDLAALKTGIDRVEIRRRNILTRGEYPYVTANRRQIRQRRFMAMRWISRCACQNGVASSNVAPKPNNVVG